MKEITFKEKFPIFTKRVAKDNYTMSSLEEYFKDKIASHPVAVFIADFDNYAHTKSLDDGAISEDILGARNIIFCFGKELMVPEVISVRPRSIGICETKDSFVISCLEAPAQPANSAMKSWLEAL
ncbi:MAG: hypothetical protein U9N42_03040 [Campylobacterota bacterium]|nr:hypothetical protein [Campylobacterota bacterium]